MHKPWNSLVLSASLGLAIALAAAGGCSSDPAAPADTGDTADASVSEDVASDGASEDVTGDADATDAADVDDAEATCEHSCLDEFGHSKKNLCPAPASDWNCVDGCCVAVFKCANDADCEAQGFAEGQCDDPRFACRCDVPTGTCHAWYCGMDTDCEAGESCVAGSCQVTASVEDLALRVVTRPTVLTPGATTQVLVEAYDPLAPDVALAADVTWSSDATDVAAVDATGLVTGGATAGTATITATLTANPATTASVAVRTVVPDAAETATILVVSDTDAAPLSGKYALLDPADGTPLATGDLPGDGVIRYTQPLPAGGVDVHVFADDADWASWLGFAGGTLLLPLAPTAYGEVELNKDQSLNPDATTLEAVSIVNGKPDFGLYEREGEFVVTISSFAMGNSLMDFNVAALLGSDVRRYIDPDFALGGFVDTDQISDIPGGLTFELSGPAIPDFWLTAAAGTHTQWTLGGRAAMDDVTPYMDDIINSMSGKTLDLGKLVSAIIPIFANFWSAVTPDITVPGDGSMEITSVTPVLRMPLGLTTQVTIPTLPSMGEIDGAPAWPEAVFMLTGAVTPDGFLVPLGINAGTDTGDKEKDPADGVVDANDKTPELDPFVLHTAPLFGGLGGPNTAYGAAIVALSVNPGGGSARRDAGSALLVRTEPSTTLPETLALPEFLGFSLEAHWDPTARTIHAPAVDGADLERVLFKGKRGHNWTVWLGAGVTDATLPVPADLFGGDATLVDRATDQVEMVFLNSLDLASDITPSALTAPGGPTLAALLLAVDRVSFLDIR